MRAGELRHRITIQRAVEVSDDLKTPTVTWQDVATVWAAVEPLSGREYLLAQNVNAELTVRIRIRYRPGVTPGMRVLYNGRVFDIQAVIDVEERHRELQLMCKEILDNG